MHNIIITNNQYVADKFKDTFNVEYFDNKDYMEILMYVRDKIHNGHELLTHPLSGSIKPNETPYKSIIISDNKGRLNYDSVSIIENSILSFEKFNLHKIKNITDRMKEDFKLIDLTVLESALNI